MMRGCRVAVLCTAVTAALGGSALAQPETFDARLAQGVEARQEGRAAEAVQVLSRLAEEATDNADVQVQLGFALLAADRLDEARGAFERVLALAPDYRDANLGLGLIAFRRGSFKRAIEQAELVLAARDDPEARDLLNRSRMAEETAGTVAEDKEADNFEARYQEAVRARTQGRAAEAVNILAGLADQAPNNADVQVQLGFALLAADRLDEAQAAFERALILAPEYRDANLGLGLVAFRHGLFGQAIQQAELVLAARDDLEARELLLRARNMQAARGRSSTDGDAAAPEKRWRLDADGVYSRLTAGFEDWEEGSLRIGHRWSPRTTVSAGWEVSRRFGLLDHYFEGRIDHRFDEKITGYILLGGAPEADFRPKIAYAAGGAAVVRASSGTLAATSFTLDAAQAHYSDNRVTTVSPGLVQYVFGGLGWISAHWINTFDRFAGHQGGYLLRGDWQATDRLFIYAGYSDAPETVRERTIETRTLFAGGSLAVSDQLSLRASVAQESRSTGFDRRVFSIGLGLEF